MVGTWQHSNSSIAVRKPAGTNSYLYLYELLLHMNYICMNIYTNIYMSHLYVYELLAGSCGSGARRGGSRPRALSRTPCLAGGISISPSLSLYIYIYIIICIISLSLYIYIYIYIYTL